MIEGNRKTHSQDIMRFLLFIVFLISVKRYFELLRNPYKFKILTKVCFILTNDLQGLFMCCSFDVRKRFNALLTFPL